jgi:iron(III) transport system substrate-binding protein
MSFIKKGQRLLFLVIFVSSFLIACESEEIIGKIEIANDPGELVVYSGRSSSLIGPIIAQFKDATGIDVQVKYGKTGEIAAVLLEEGDKSPADVFFAQDTGGLAVVVNKGMAEKIDAEILSKVPAWAQSADGQWVGISGRARAVVYNTESINPATDLPETLQGFCDSKWKGRIGWPPTNGSFPFRITKTL